jgi:hypothetical protein
MAETVPFSFQSLLLAPGLSSVNISSPSYLNLGDVLRSTRCPVKGVISLVARDNSSLPDNFASASFINDLLRHTSLELRLLLNKVYGTAGRVTEDAVVNELVDSSGVQYAVIAGLRTETGPERLVIAYPNEKSLRDLLAASSILAVGFSSREDAVAGSRAPRPAAISYQRMPAASADLRTERHLQGLNWSERRGGTSPFRRLARFLFTSYSEVATTVIAIYFSRNALSAVIRMALGSSV